MDVGLFQIVHWGRHLKSWFVLSGAVHNVGPCYILSLGPWPLQDRKIEVLSSMRNMEQGVPNSVSVRLRRIAEALLEILLSCKNKDSHFKVWLFTPRPMSQRTIS